jgi:hypothetical protein
MSSLLFPLRFAVLRRASFVLSLDHRRTAGSGRRTQLLCFVLALRRRVTIFAKERESARERKITKGEEGTVLAPIWGKRLLPQTTTPPGDITPSNVHKRTLCKISSRPHLSLVEST